MLDMRRNDLDRSFEDKVAAFNFVGITERMEELEGSSVSNRGLVEHHVGLHARRSQVRALVRWGDPRHGGLCDSEGAISHEEK